MTPDLRKGLEALRENVSQQGYFDAQDGISLITILLDEAALRREEIEAERIGLKITPQDPTADKYNARIDALCDMALAHLRGREASPAKGEAVALRCDLEAILHHLQADGAIDRGYISEEILKLQKQLRHYAAPAAPAGFALVTEEMKTIGADAYRDAHAQGATINGLMEAVYRAMLAAPVAPEGFALVPMEPTIDMLIAGTEASCLGRPSVDDSDYARSIYRAMLLAAAEAKS